MKPTLGQKYLITTDNWFFAPDGETYRAVFGTLHSIDSDEQVLGIKTNRGSSNWYVVIGDMIIAGCQIHYCIRTDAFSDEPAIREIEHEGELRVLRNPITRIYDADRAVREKAASRHTYNRSKIAWELERTALNDGFYGNALRAAKDLPEVTPEERSLLDRHATGQQTGTDHVALQTLALKIDNASC